MTKANDNKHRSHAQKMVDRLSKKASQPEAQNSGAAAASTPSSSAKKRKDPTFREQYEVIREDVLKLRTDLQKGYDMAKGLVEKKSILKQILRTR